MKKPIPKFVILFLMFGIVCTILSAANSKYAKTQKQQSQTESQEQISTNSVEQNAQLENAVLDADEVPGSDPNFLTNIVPEKTEPQVAAATPQQTNPAPKPTPAPAPTPKKVVTTPPKTTTKPSPTPAPASTPSCATGSFTAQFQCLINEYRKSKGLNALVYEAKLNATALAHSTWMNKNNTLSHVGVDGTRFYQRCEMQGTTCDAENVARGYTSAKALFDAWKKSPGHDANMLRTHTVMGLALAGTYSTLVMR